MNFNCNEFNNVHKISNDYNELVSKLEEFKIEKYIIHSDFSVTALQSVNLKNKKLVELPFFFKAVAGNFDCSNNQLTSLKGCPQVVQGSFTCKNNKLDSMEHFPDFIAKDIDISNNEIEELKLQNIVFGNVDFSNNKIKQFKNFPEVVNGNLFIKNNNINESELINFNTHISQMITSDFNEFSMKVNNGFSINSINESSNFMKFISIIKEINNLKNELKSEIKVSNKSIKKL